jgi:hypothetical protein
MITGGAMNFIPLLSTVITFIFAASVLNRYQHRKGKHLLMWGIGLILYGLGTLSEVILGFTFNEFVLKIWYVSGAMLTAAWLGQGTIWLLVRRPGVARWLTYILAGVSLLAVVLVMSAPINPGASYDLARPISEQYKEFLTRNGMIIALTIILNIYGTIALVGGALYSAYLFLRKQVLINRVIGNILIAAGAMFPAMAGSFVGAGLVDMLYLSELLGVILMYIGFLQATVTRPVEQPSQPLPVKS